MRAAFRARLRYILPVALLVAVTLIAVIALTIGLRQFVQDYVVVPVAYAAWFIDMTLRSIPQSTFWAVLVVIAVLAGLESVGALRKLIRNRAAVTVMPETAGQSRLLERRELFERLSDSTFARERIAFEMRGLMVQLLAHQERQSAEEIEQRVRAHAIAAPPEILALLTDWRTWLTDEPADAEAARSNKTFRRLRLRWRSIQRMIQPTRYQPRLLTAIAYMESLSGGLYARSAPQEETNGGNNAN